MKKPVSHFALIIMTFFIISCEKKATIPILTTTEVTQITTSSAFSGGIITNDGGALIISKGICWGTLDDPTIEDNFTSETGSSNTFTSSITGLSPKTKYYVRSYATNSAGTGYGKSESFMTTGDVPSSSLVEAINIAVDSAVLKGIVNPNLLSTTVSFEWGITLDYGNNIIVSESPVTGSNPVNVSAKLTGLNPKTLYHFRIKAENSLGIINSNDNTFTTLGDLPGITSKEVSNLQINAVALNGTVNPNYLSTTALFEWGTTTSYGNNTTDRNLASGNSAANISADLTGLNPGTTYHYRIRASNSLGVTYSSDKTFKTLGDKPSVTSKDTSNLQINAVTINGSVNPNYLETIVTIEWGTTTSYGNTTTNQNIGNGTTSANVSANLAGLNPGTIYHYRINATNELGTTQSNDMTFRTLGDVPSALIESAGNIQYNTATIKMSVNPNYFQTTGILEYGHTSSYGNSISITQNPLTGKDPITLYVDLSGLTQGTLYHLRITATNQLGISNSEDFTFTTLAPISDIEGNTYNIKTIGSQIWMTENLKTTKYNNGDPIGTTNPLTLDISNENMPKYQWAYEGNESFAAIYGRLYTGYTVTDPRKVCPLGWHIPSDTEWTTLTNYLTNNGYGYEGSGDDIGKSMAATSLWADNSTPGNVGNDLASNNSSGFSALPAGYRSNDDNVDGVFVVLNWVCSWWSSTDITDKIAWQRMMQNQFNNVTRSYFGGKRNGISVRCIKDQTK